MVTDHAGPGQHRTPANGFGTLLRSWRDRSDPSWLAAAVTSRRSPGLRREELAGLAGLSMDYLVQLEQGRAVRPSASVVIALARALRLTEEDAARLHVAARLAAPTGAVNRLVPEGVERFVTRLERWPTAVYSADWWLLRWNQAWAALLGDPAALLGRARNLVWHEMTQETQRVWVEPAELETFRDALVGDLRVAHIAHPDDAELTDLIAGLRAVSPDFTARWRAARPVLYRGARKQIEHPRVGSMTLDSDILEAPGSDLHLIVYSAAPGTADASRLDLLSVVGTETFGASPQDGRATRL